MALAAAAFSGSGEPERRSCRHGIRRLPVCDEEYKFAEGGHPGAWRTKTPECRWRPKAMLTLAIHVRRITRRVRMAGAGYVENFIEGSRRDRRTGVIKPGTAAIPGGSSSPVSSCYPCGDDEQIVDAVCVYAAHGLKNREGVVLIATKAHRDAIVSLNGGGLRHGAPGA